MEHIIQQYMPHGHCFLWQKDLLAFHVISDALIAFSYFTIPLAIYFFMTRKKMRNRLISVLFISFIVSCGITHIFSIWNFWHADYWLSGAAKAVCAGISVTTAILLWVLMPKALKLPTVSEIEDLNVKLKEANANLELKVKSRTRQLEIVNQELGHINAIISHDFKNSLGVLMGYVQMIDKSDSAEKNQKYNQMMAQVGQQLDNFINDIVGIVQIGQDQLEIVPIDLNVLLSKIKNEFHLKLDELKGKIILENLPTVSGVESLLHQLFVNLLSNSMKYNSKDRSLEIRLTSKDDDGFYLLTWEDNGLGIQPEDYHRVFEMYKRGRNVVAEGSGIGLAFCRKICRIHGGEIFIDANQPTRGTRFVIQLPKEPVLTPKETYAIQS